MLLGQPACYLWVKFALSFRFFDKILIFLFYSIFWCISDFVHFFPPPYEWTYDTHFHWQWFKIVSLLNHRQPMSEAQSLPFHSWWERDVVKCEATEGKLWGDASINAICRYKVYRWRDWIDSYHFVFDTGLACRARSEDVSAKILPIGAVNEGKTQ